MCIRDSNNSVDNWISWVPLSGDLWRPFNVQKVNSIGLDMNLKQKFRINKKQKLSLIYNLSYAEPIIKAVYTGTQALIGKQLIYVPAIQHALAISFEMRRHEVFTNWRYIGSRFTTSDNDIGFQLPAYALWDIGHRFRFKFGKIPFSSRFQLNNILNKSYENIAYRAMPGRNLEFSIGCKFWPEKVQDMTISHFIQILKYYHIFALYICKATLIWIIAKTTWLVKYRTPYPGQNQIIFFLL